MIFAEIKNSLNIVRNLRARDAEIQQGLNRGLGKVGLKILEWADPYVPVDTGAMKRSKFTSVIGFGINTRVQVGYKIGYAVFVHEDLGKLHGEAYNEAYADEIAAGLKHKRGPLQQAKFLSKAIEEHRSEIVQIIKSGS